MAVKPFEPKFMKMGVLTAALQELTPREIRDADPDKAIEDWLQTLNRARSPVFINIERQQVIQQIITRRDTPEHVADPCRRFLLIGGAFGRSATHASAA